MLRSRRFPSLVACLLGASLGAFAVAAPAQAAPSVVVSIKPVHALVAAVMGGVGMPSLIVEGAASPHTYVLRPTDAQRLAGADLVFWVGPIYEGFLTKPLAALAGRAAIVELDKAPGVSLLPAREGGAWEPDAHEHDHQAGEAGQDGHLWLDPGNAKAILRAAAARLSLLDPPNATRYAANAAAAEQGIDGLDATLRARLEGVRSKPFIVFHDGYQYLERHYGLSAVGSITVRPESPPGARRVQAIRARVAALGVRCVFSEPQFEPALVRTVIEGTPARAGTLDPLGAGIPDGPELYAKLMNELADSLVGCLGSS
jgi:zinc transport system substrate-binding protein